MLATPLEASAPDLVNDLVFERPLKVEDLVSQVTVLTRNVVMLEANFEMLAASVARVATTAKESGGEMRGFLPFDASAVLDGVRSLVTGLMAEIAGGIMTKFGKVLTDYDCMLQYHPSLLHDGNAAALQERTN